MAILNPFQARILTVLVQERSFLTTAQVSRLAAVSWATAEKYLEEMYSLGWLERRGRTKCEWKAILPEGFDA